MAGSITTAVAATPALAPLAAATIPLTVYVRGGAGCVPGGAGTIEAPFCTISSAATVVRPGQTVLVAPGNYPETVAITQSGTNSAPITFVAANGPYGNVRVGNSGGTITGTALKISHVHDVALKGFAVIGTLASDAIQIDSSANITVDEGGADGIRGAGIRISGASSNVTVSRETITGFNGPALAIDAGVTGTIVSANVVTPGGTGIVVTDAHNSSIIGNTVVNNCKVGITIAGTSPGSVIKNNIVDTAGGYPAAPRACPSPAQPSISVSAASAAQTVAAYNLIDPLSAAPLYSWGGTAYTDLGSFASATGQGSHDLAANPQLGAQEGGDLFWYPVATTSPAVDSGDASVAGELPTDYLGNPRTDDPDVNNTGTGIGYHDRGAVEFQGPITGGMGSITRTVGGGPFDVTATAVHSYSWVANGPGGHVYYQFAGDPFPISTTALSVTHTARKAGSQCVTVYVTDSDFRSGWGAGSSCTVVGATYVPMTPTRILDTRAAVGVGTSTPVAPNADVIVPIRNLAVPAADISALVVNVTVTAPTAAGYLTVYPDGRALPAVSNINFVAGQTVPNLATVALTNDKIIFHNGSAGTVHVIADIEGFFGATGNGFKPIASKRVLDTRNGTGTSTVGPVAANGDIRLDMSGALPSDATAAVLNVTVTQPTSAGFVTAFPDGTPMPQASNLNFVAGQTVPNLVMVPVTNGRVAFHNGSSGSVHLLVDLAGYFGTAASGASQTYVPFGPTRVADTRSQSGAYSPLVSPVPPGGEISIYAGWINGSCVPVCPLPTAHIFNFTVTAPTAAGFITAYPNTGQRPASSNLNFVANQTVPNLAIITDDIGIRAYNGSSGSVQLLIDEAGYFIAPPA